MKAWRVIVISVLLGTGECRAEVLFGNSSDGSYGYGIYSSSPDPYVTGAAVSFSPKADFTFSSVTLAVSNYTQPFGLQLLEGSDPNKAYPVGLFSGPSRNDGAVEDVTFESVYFNGYDWAPAPLTLDAGDTYWLFAYGNVGSCGTIEWMGGDQPCGEAAYEGTALYSGDPEGNFSAGLYVNPPAFSINAVPEPAAPVLVIVFGVGILVSSRPDSRSGRKISPAT